MTEAGLAHQQLLKQVAERLSRTPSVTDHIMLTKWRVLSACQSLLGDLQPDVEMCCRVALEAFVAHGPGAECDEALDAVHAAMKRSQIAAGTVLPVISTEKRTAVAAHLDKHTARGVEGIEHALRVLPALRERTRTMGHAVPLLGMRHRLDLVATILEDNARTDRDRARAAAAVLYVDEVRDVIPDTLGVIGMLDDDYALRVALEEAGQDVNDECLHWSEKISSLWDDLPFLQGVNLQRWNNPISTTWLDRVNSYVSYSHAMSREYAALVLLQPSIACSPLHTIVSLMGLVVFDAVTSSQNKAHALHVGQTYEVDGLVVQFDGLAGSHAPGWLRLKMRDGVVYQPPGLADRMVSVEPRRLSSLRQFSLRPSTIASDPVQRFFKWDTAIGAASIESRLVLVASKQRTLNLLDGVQSNGVPILDHELVRFVSTPGDDLDFYGTLVLVVPSLSMARQLLDRGCRVQAILVDGYDRLRHGRHELPFLMGRRDAPRIISWSAAGYYPTGSLTWLPTHNCLEVSSEDLVTVLELDDATTDPAYASLWEAATGIIVRQRVIPAPAAEVAVLEAIDAFLQATRTSQALPDYWKYHLTALAKTLRALIASTPAEWSEIKRFAVAWSASINDKWSSLRPSAITALAMIRKAESRVRRLMENVPDAVNSRATALVGFLSEQAGADDTWQLVCDYHEQVTAASSALQMLGLTGAAPVLLRDLAVCSPCVITGWMTASFARRLWAHTPRAVVTLTDEADRERWERAVNSRRKPVGQHLLSAISGSLTVPTSSPFSSPVIQDDRDADSHSDDHPGGDRETQSSTDERVPCVFLWVTGEADARVLEFNGRVVVEDGDLVREQIAARLRPDDRVILGLGSSRWSPAEEFTQAVIQAAEASHSELVRKAKDWRRALRMLVEARKLSMSRLRTLLAAVGIEREEQTLEGWLDFERASPIAPRGLRIELEALWPLIEKHADYSLNNVVTACEGLRALRVASGRALLQVWKGRKVALGIDESLLDDVVGRLRRDVQVYEVDTVAFGQVPRPMLGWRIPDSLAGRFASEAVTADATPEADREEDAGTS